jgi:hypothetical protein
MIHAAALVVPILFLHFCYHLLRPPGSQNGALLIITNVVL